jgi:hypothetical protein
MSWLRGRTEAGDGPSRLSKPVTLGYVFRPCCSLTAEAQEEKKWKTHSVAHQRPPTTMIQIWTMLPVQTAGKSGGVVAVRAGLQEVRRVTRDWLRTSDDACRNLLYG